MPVAPKRSFKGNQKIWDSNGDPIVPPFEITDVNATLEALNAQSELLESMVEQLKILNMHLSIINDTNIREVISHD